MVSIDDLFTTYGVPVLVALFTTLVVEYFAKPRLEARKARLIRDRQQIDEVVFAFQGTALGGGGLLPDATARTNPQGQNMQRHQLQLLEKSTEGIDAALSRLPHKFVQRHREHIGATSTFIGFMRARIRVELGKPEVSVEEISEITASLEKLDVYFVAHVSFGDSQESWVKRTFTKTFMRKDLEQDRQQVLERWGLRGS